MQNTTTSYWVAGLILVALIAIAAVIWYSYSASPSTPGVPNTGEQTTLPGTSDITTPSDSSMINY